MSILWSDIENYTSSFQIKDRSFKAIFLGDSTINIYSIINFLKKGTHTLTTSSIWSRTSVSKTALYNRFWNGRYGYIGCGVEQLVAISEAKCIFIVFDNENYDSFQTVARFKSKCTKNVRSTPIYAIGYKRKNYFLPKFSATKEYFENEYGTIKYIEFDTHGTDHQISIFQQTLLNIFESIYQAEIQNEIIAHIGLQPQNTTYNDELQLKFDNGLYATPKELVDQKDIDRYEETFFMVFRNKYTFRYIFRYIQRLHKLDGFKVYNFFTMTPNYMISYRKLNILKERLQLYKDQQPLEYINIVNLLRCKELDMELFSLVYQYHLESFDNESTEYWLTSAEVRTLKFGEIVENAVAGGNIEIVTFLLEKGFPLTNECMDIAIQYEHHHLVEYFETQTNIKDIPKKEITPNMKFGVNSQDDADDFNASSHPKQIKQSDSHNHYHYDFDVKTKKKKKSLFERLFGSKKK